MKSIFKKFILLLLSLSLVSVFAYGQKPDLYTTLPTPIEVTSFPYFVDNFDSDAMAEGAPTGMQGACPTFPCCSGVWYKITLDTRGSLVSALETTKTIPPSSGLVWFKAESDDITTTDQLTYINSSNNFCGFAGFTSPSRGYAWRFKYTPSYNSESSESQSPANMSSFNSTYLSDPFPSDLTQYPGSGWRNDIELESGEHYLEPGTYWLYAWNKNQLEGVGGEQTKFVIDFVELCPDGFTCTNESVTICDTESYTTQNGQVITETTSVEETIGTEITTYNITVDEAITCCPDGYTCSEVDVTECASLTYTTPGGNTTSETGAVLDEDTEAQTRTVYNVTFDRVESKADVFQDAIITASGSVTYQANTNVTGVLSFDKAQDYWVDLNALQDDLNGTNRSAFMWVKSEADVVSNDQILFAINTGSGGNVAIFKIDNDGENLELFDGSDNQSASYDMGDEQWHYVGYTYNAATTETVVYVDGIENDRFRDNQSTVADSKYSLGQEFDGGSDSDHMNGDMAEISIWDEVLTGAEIKAAMQSKITNSHPKYANLVGYYSTFGECSEDATVLKDHSGKGNDGVMQNGLQVDFKNVQAIEGFNAIDWYTNLSWSKDGAEISTDATYTTDVAAGSYSFTATRDFIKATDSWTMTLNSNAATVDEIADETLCADDPITRTVTTNTVNYLDFEEAEENHISIDGLADNLANKSRSAFMWLNKESNIGSGGFDEVLVFQDTDVDNLSRFYIRETERLALWDGTNDRLNSRVLSNDTWYFVGYTYDHTTGEAKLYVNGTEEDAGTLSMPLGLGWFTSIGMKYNDNGPVDHMDGKLAEITFWDVVLTPEEITGLMAAAPANDAANLVASYGTLKNIADNQLRDLTGNGYDGLTSHNTIIIKDMEDTLANYDASANYLISWKKTGTEFDTDAIGNIKIDEGTTAYSVSYGTPLFQKTEEFSLSYTNLLPTQPVSTTVGALGSVTFEVDEIAGASYQWFKRGFGAQEINSGNNGIPTTGIFNDLKESNGIVYLGTRDGLSISRDNGNSFITISSSTPGFGDEDDILKIQADGDKVYAMTRSFLNISDDQGTSWRSIDFSQALSSIHSVAIDFQVIGDEIHLIGKTSHNTDFYYRSLDGGENWTSREISFTTNSSVLLSTSYKSLFVDGSTILITATGSNSSAGTLTGGMVRSNDGGITWEREIPGVDGYPSGNYFQSIFKKNEVIYLGGFNGLYISNDDGTTWVSGDNLTNYKNTTGVDDIVSVGNRVYVSSAGIQYTDDNGQNWVDLNEDFDPRLRSIAISDMGSYAINLATGLFDQLFVVNDREELENETDNTSPNQIQGATTSRLTINNLSLDQNDVEYFVEVSKDGCTQPSDDVTLTVLDIPIITQYTPARGGSDIDPAATISIEWSKDITAGTTGALRIFESDTDTEVQSFAPGDLSITGSTLSITPTNLDNSTSYYITIDADLVKDAGDGGNLALSGKDSWTFSTACETLVTAQPTDQSRLVGGSASFSVPVVSGASYQWFQNTEIATNIDPESNIGLSSIGSAYADGENYYVTGGSMRQSYFSSDQGMTWKDISTNRSGLYIYADGNQIYQSGTDGIAVSYDAGVSFKEIGNIENGLQESPGLTWDFVYGKEDRIYLKMRQFYVSLDRGDNFVAKNLIANGVEPGSVFEIREYDGVLHLATSSGLYLSSDYGDTFTRKTTADGLASDNVTASLNINGILYLVSITGKNPDAVYRIEVSTDSGGSFTTISETILGSTEIRNIAAGPDGKLYVATPQGIRISDDQGQTFELLTISNELGANDILQVHVGSDYTIYAVTSKGLTVVTTRVKVTNSQDLSSANAISGANTEVLTVDNLTLSADQSEYFVTVAKGDCQESSDDVTLSVSCEPLVLTQPADQNSAQGGSATFSVPEVSGASYQWYRRGRWVNSKQESNPFPIDDIVVVEDEGAATDNIVTFVDGRMYIATPSGLVSRANEEADWEVTDASSGNNFPSNQVNAVVSSSSKAVYAATSAGLAVLRPNETNWEVYNTQSGNGFPSTNQISNVFVSEDETIYLLSREPTSLAILEAGETTWDVIDETTSGNFSDLGSILYDVLATEDGAVYISTRANGFFRLPSTVPFFKTWEKFDRFNSDLSLGSIYNLSYANGKIYAHGSGLVTGYAPEMEIFDIATNTWSSFDNPKGNAFPPSATIYGLNNDNGTLYAQVEEDLYRLGNGGSEWNLITDLSASNGRGYIYHFEETYYRPSETQGLSTLTDIALSNDPAENTESNSISGATSTTLTIDNLSLEHSTTEYFVVVTKGECEETSDFAQVNVLDVPLITSFFPAQNAVDVPLDGDLILNYNRSVAPRAGNIKIFEYDTDVEVLSIPIENTTRSGGTISFTEPLNLQPGTKYYVTIDAGVVSDSGSNLSLAVTDKDYWSFVTDCGGLITTQLMDQTAGIGESVTFEIPEIAGATYQWRQSVNGIFGAISDEPGKIEGTSTKSLTISNLEASDNGNRYLLKVTTDNCEAFTNNVQLNVTTGPPSTDPFIITIITTAADESFSIPAPSDYNYNFYVEWGDGGVNSAQTSEVSYTYTTAGTYDVKIYGDFPNPAFGVNTSNARKITDIKAWGDIAWESFNQAFEGSSLTILSVSEAPDLSNVTDLSEMFRAARSFNDDLSAWDVSNVNNMSNLFNSADAFNGDISTWNVANVTTMEGMFRDCETFNQDVSGWNVSNVINMDDMFNYAEVFDADISSWNVSNVTSMSGTFLNARVFNQDISSWSVDNVTNMSSLFGNARLFNQDISSWNVAAVTSMSSMFNSAHAFNQDISGWNVDNVTSMSRMFSGTEAFNHSLDAWNVSNVTNMSEMFSGAVVFNSSISSWNVSNVTDMSEMFLDALAFNQDISSWDVSSSLVFNNMFEDAPSFDQNLGSWNIKPALEDDAEALADMFNGSGLTTANYDNILIGWASIDGLPDEAYLYNVPATYCISEERRDYLLNTLSWEINDQGKATDCVITGPILSATLPADNAIEVSLSPSIQITFDQTVNKGTGEIEIRRSSDDQVLTSISVASTLVTVDNAIASIQLGDSQLAIETEYYITIPSGAFTTIAGTAFDGITDKTTWSFTTIEGLKLVSLTPVNGATDVSENSFSMEFNYPIETTLYSNAYLNLVEDDSRIATLGFSSSNIEYSEDKKTISFYFSDESIQSDVPIVLAGNTAYYITMINFITSSTTGEFFSLDEKTDWTFTTAETSFSADVLSPENNAEGISRNLQDNEWEFIAGTIPGHVLYFARDITVSNAGAFTLYNGSTDEVVYTVNLATNPATVLNMSDLEDEFESETPLAEYAGVIVIKSSGNDVITIKDDYQMEAGQQYYWNVDESAITANDGKTFVGISDKNTWSFTTELVVEGSISIASLSPADNSTNLDPNIINTSSATLPRFSVTFEEAIKNGNTDAVFELYDAATDELLSSQTLNSTIAAPGVNPAQHDFGFYSYTFEKGKSYYILVEEGMFLSSANDAPSVGITNKTVWNFSTIPSPGAPSLTAVSPMAGATGISVTSDIILTFNENIQSGSVEGASVRLFSDDNVEVAAFSSDQMTISGTKVTIAITSDLAFSTTYYILIDDEAFVSFNNVSFSGVSDATLYTFTTEDKRNTPPVAGEVSFEGNIEVNQELTANYSYTDADSDTESGTTFQWYSADDASGANKTAISGATAQTFTLTNNESAKYVALGITPNDGKDAGQEVFSNYDGPIAAAVVPTVVSTLPTDGAVDIGVNPTLTIVMSEPVTAGSGSIFISGDGFNTGISATGSNVEINAETITISDLTGGFGSLPYGKFFTVTFDATAFVDADGNNSAGLSSQTAWNFTTKEANVAPVAQGVSIKKSLVVDGELQGSYTYFDDNGDTEAGTVYSWYRSDDNTGTNKIAISGPTAQNYTVVTADNGKYLTFEVTPSDGTLSGEASESAYFGPILINDGNTNIPPAFTSDALTSIKDNETYTYTVTYEDINNDVPVLTKTTGPAWLSVTGFELSGSPTASNIGDHQVVLTLDDQNGGTVTQAFTITVIQSNTAPTAVSVAVDVHFNFNVGMPFGGVYNFIDAEQDTDNSTYKWYRSDDNAGANKTEIPGAASKIYKATIDDAGKYLSFEVTPNDGKVDGTAVESEAVGPITKKIPSLSLAAINKVYGDADFDLSATTNSSGAITYTFDNDQTGANLSDVRVTLGNVGQITVNVSLAADAEYTARTVQGTITVSKRPITFTAQNASKVYGAADPSFFSFDVTQGNLVSDAEVIRLSRDAGEAVGTYSINLSEGEGAENYDITTVGGTFTITKVPITVTAVAATKVYGDADPTFTYNITSGALITGDELSGAITRVVG
ncbi:MAG: BspA family leucine-rich repeat surface protein, partial [Cyclobacteriaceae bacterium]